MDGRRRTRAFPLEYATRVGETLVKVDACLCDALHYLDPAVLGSPFPARIADATPVHSQLLLDHIRQIRLAMQMIVERQRLPLPTPNVSSLSACRLCVNAAKAILAIAKLELRNESPMAS
jgi:hypothetical protein